MYTSAQYEIRMNEFCSNHLQHPTIEELRPRNSISPFNELENTQSAFNDSQMLNNPHLNLSHIQSINSPYVNKLVGSLYPLGEISNTASPYSVQPRAKKELLKVPLLQYQSTPNKSTESVQAVPKRKANFHSISDLARSSDDSSNSSSVVSSDMSSGYLSSSSTQSTLSHSGSFTATSAFTEFYKNIVPVTSSNPTIKIDSMKENGLNYSEFIYKTRRRARAQITKQQREILEYAYSVKCYPDSNEVEYLCGVLGFEENVIRIWFQNKRARTKTSRKN